MEDALRPPHSHSTSEDDSTRAGLRALELAAVERDAQVARLGVQLQHAREDTERARAEATQARAETHEVQLAALRAKYERAKGWWVVNHKRRSARTRTAPRMRNTIQTRAVGAGALPRSSPDPNCRSPVVLASAHWAARKPHREWEHGRAAESYLYDYQRESQRQRSASWGGSWGGGTYRSTNPNTGASWSPTPQWNPNPSDNGWPMRR
ncbi:hypothetical protein FB451DRAFT_1391446 [Mycena latifolia]|nr:hypothetical protein FB451DRAFT_1391446 [Mycena latifolia]